MGKYIFTKQQIKEMVSDLRFLALLCQKSAVKLERGQKPQEILYVIRRELRRRKQPLDEMLALLDDNFEYDDEDMNDD